MKTFARAVFLVICFWASIGVSVDCWHKLPWWDAVFVSSLALSFVIERVISFCNKTFNLGGS